VNAPRDPITEMDLLAYADGRLDGARRREVEALLGEDTDLRARVRADARMHARVRELESPVLDEQVPEHLLAILDRLDEVPRRRTLRGARPVVAAAATLVLGVSVGWFAGRDAALVTDGGSLPDLLDGAVARISQPVAQSTPATTGAGVAPRSRLPVPDLSEAGFQLAGSAAVPDARGDALRVDYRRAGDVSLTVYLRRVGADAAPAIQLRERDGVAVAYWTRDDLELGLVLEGAADEAATLARHVDRLLAACRGETGCSGTPGPLAPSTASVQADPGDASLNTTPELGASQEARGRAREPLEGGGLPVTN